MIKNYLIINNNSGEVMRSLQKIVVYSVFSLIGISNAIGQTTSGENEFDCVVTPTQVLELGSPVVGIVEKVLVKRGDAVAAGEIVATLESSIEKAAVEITRIRAENTSAVALKKAQLGYVSKQFKRAQDLNAKGVSSGQKFDEAKARIEVALQEYEQAQHELDLFAYENIRAEAILSQRTIKSPINGFVQSVESGPGEYVYQDASVLTVVQLNPLFVETFVPVSRYGQFKIGMIGKVKIEQPTTLLADAKISVIDKVFDASSGTMAIRLELPNDDDLIPAGQRCVVTF